MPSLVEKHSRRLWPVVSFRGIVTIWYGWPLNEIHTSVVVGLVVGTQVGRVLVGRAFSSSLGGRVHRSWRARGVLPSVSLWE